MRELTTEACRALEPIGHAPFAVTKWELDPDVQTEPDENGGA